MAATKSQAFSRRTKRPLKRLRIRRATVDDVPGILECLASGFAPYRRRYTGEAFDATVLDERRLRRRLHRMAVLVAAGARGRIVGTISVKSISPEHAHLRGMAVLPEAQRRGVGAALLRRSMLWARREGHGVVTLETTAVLARATEFYLAHGFRPTGRTRRWGGMRLIGYECRLAPRRYEVSSRPQRGASHASPATL